MRFTRSLVRLLELLGICLIFPGLLGCQRQLPVRVLKNLEYSSYASEKGKTPLLLDLYLPQTRSSQALPILMYIHGGGWLENSKESCPGTLVARRGYALACINYRYSSQALFPAQIHDVKNAVRWLRDRADRYRLDPDRFGAWGDSAGGHLSALLGTSAGVKELEKESNYPNISSQIQAVGSWYGPTDFTQKIELAKLANPVAYLDANDPPFLIIHGELDTVVPVSQSDLLARALKEKGVDFKYIRMPNLGHSHRGENGERFDPYLIDITIRFFDRHLK